MSLKHLCVGAILLIGGGTLGLAYSSSSPGVKSVTRIHLENGADAALTFLAIGVSEEALKTAENRLCRPLPPDSVYSAVLSRPGNYWVRAEVETDGYRLERILGPIRLANGVSDWRFHTLDSGPLYSMGANGVSPVPLSNAAL